ncbi:uncharacterized protein BX664DRAFT_329820 [Halteromyces radiatus]|uniref:uncharacterized protein n=1 Tax=Halteromyces radiatus TaxID=101107 RepID=UPI00221FB9A8|nr:uncharacterized protein BX664DRAFT_329820 [Halteromyces radiatus]KAI8093485.1 hypothetical protein BX664DRAFT_329820 [Halteromyces radiatus]
MDVWNKLCMQAFDGDQQADEFILLIQQCGKTSLEDLSFQVKIESCNEKQEQLLLSLGFTPIDEQIYSITGEQWKAFGEAKRLQRKKWHEALQKRLEQHLREALDRIQQPLTLTHVQRLVLVREFSRNHIKDPGSVPFLRGLVGCLRAQLYKRKLVDWQVTEYVMTQNGEEPMMDYIRLIRGVLGMKLVFRKHGSQIDDSLEHLEKIPRNGMVTLDMTATSHFEPSHTTAPVITAAAAATDDDNYMIWRMNPDLSDEQLADILESLPRQQCNQNYPLSQVTRSTSALLPSSPILRWLTKVIRRCLSIFSMF